MGVIRDGSGTIPFTFYNGQMTMFNSDRMPYKEIQRNNYVILKVKSPLKGWVIFPMKFIVENRELIEIIIDNGIGYCVNNNR